MNFIITLFFGKIQPLHEMDATIRFQLANQLRDRRTEPRPFIDVINSRLEQVVQNDLKELRKENEERKLFWLEQAKKKYGSFVK